MSRLEVGIVGCGTAGSAAALFLHRAGHSVEVFEQVEDPEPVGAGILLQPTGMAVLNRLGVLGPVADGGSRIDRVRGRTVHGRSVMDMRYSELRPGLFGLGVHRGTLFMALFEELRRTGLPVRCGVEIVGLERTESRQVLVDAEAERHGPFDLIVVADGARSRLRPLTRLPARVESYPWGAIWAILRDPDERFVGMLDQYYRGTEKMVGFLPTGCFDQGDGPAPTVSLFWSIRLDRIDAWRRRGLGAWKDAVRRLAPHAQPLLEQIEEPGQLAFARYHDVRMRRWHGDGVVVIGDAGHAMSPQLGQGANLGLQDAWTLARFVLPGAELDRALARYSHARHGNLRFYGLASRWMTPLFQSSGGRLARPRDLLLHPLGRLPPLRRQMLLTLAGAKTGALRTLPVDELIEAEAADGMGTGAGTR